MASGRPVRAVAFAPAHVTGVFAPALDARDPRARGSRGAGIVVELGVVARAEFRPTDRRQLRLVSDLRTPIPITESVARRMFPARTGRLTVELTHQLPVGQGFGMSAAAATATALAVGALSGRSREDAIEVAHLADLFGGGGLGGVASIAGGGGIEFRRRAGIPPYGDTVHLPMSGSLFLGITGSPLPSPRLLHDPRLLARVAAASEGLDALLRRPGVPPFFELSERFTDRLKLGPAPLGRILLALRKRGAWAGQAMFGRSFFARPKSARARREVVAWLERSGLRAVELAPAQTGPRILR
ncbi:MAG: hypothetical protein WB947_05295 [Thermoplasmata archaeon]